MDTYGYFTATGFKGRLPNGEWMLFASHSDYVEYVCSEKEDTHDDVA